MNDRLVGKPDKREGTAAYTGLEYCNKLFAWKERFEKLSPEGWTKQRLKEETPILENKYCAKGQAVRK